MGRRGNKMVPPLELRVFILFELVGFAGECELRRVRARMRSSAAGGLQPQVPVALPPAALPALRHHLQDALPLRPHAPLHPLRRLDSGRSRHQSPPLLRESMPQKRQYTKPIQELAWIWGRTPTH